MKNSKKLQKVALMARVNKFLKESQPKKPNRALDAITGLSQINKGEFKKSQ